MNINIFRFISNSFIQIPDIALLTKGLIILFNKDGFSKI